jgi:hypothetical protein
MWNGMATFYDLDSQFTVYIAKKKEVFHSKTNFSPK